MTATAPVQRIDLTAPGDSLTYVEILPPGGIVRVNTNLVNFHTGQPSVVVEVEPNSTYRPKTAAEDWHTEVREHIGMRTDVTLTRDEPSDSRVSGRQENEQ
jgi:hypothetical protein